MDDDQDLVRALRRAGTDDPGVDPRALVAGAHRRARVLRRRRQGALGVVAVVALAVPLGVSQWARTTPPPTVVASPTAPAVVDGEVVAAAMLPDATVLQVLPGASGQSTAISPSSSGALLGGYGMCTDLTLPAQDQGATSLVGGRTRTWTTAPSAGVTFPPAVSESVRVFSADGARALVDFARDQLATACADPEETGPWSPVPNADGSVTVDGAALGEDSVTGYAQSQTDVWRTRTVIAQGDVVVDLETTLSATTAQEAVRTSHDLARQALAAVVEVVPAAGGPS